jgi:hypothetical protein
MNFRPVSTNSSPKRRFAGEMSVSSTDPIGGPDNLPAARRTRRRTNRLRVPRAFTPGLHATVAGLTGRHDDGACRAGRIPALPRTRRHPR